MNQQKYLREVLKDSLNDVCKNHCPIILETVDFSTFHIMLQHKSQRVKNYFQRVHTETCRVL